MKSLMTRTGIILLMLCSLAGAISEASNFAALPLAMAVNYGPYGEEDVEVTIDKILDILNEEEVFSKIRADVAVEQFIERELQRAHRERRAILVAS